MSLLYYDTSSSSDCEADFVSFKDSTADISELSDEKIHSLPPPKRHVKAPAPPPPVDVAPPEIAKEVLLAKPEDEHIIQFDLEEYRQRGQEVAENNKIISDKSQLNGVGHVRERSHLRYLAQVDLNTQEIFEAQQKKITRARIRARQMYGW